MAGRRAAHILQRRAGRDHRVKLGDDGYATTLIGQLGRPLVSHDIVPVSHHIVPVSRDIVPVSHDIVPVSHDIVPVSRDIVPVSRDIVPVSHDIVMARLVRVI